MKGLVGYDEILADGIPQIAFVGRSNVGKSSFINLLTNTKIARTSSFAGRTQEINVFLINDSLYLVDLPGYGFARASGSGREKIGELIDSYLFNSIYTQKKVIMIIDANVGLTDKDILMLAELENNNKNFIIIANKIDKMTQSIYHKNFKEINKIVGQHEVIPFSIKNKKNFEKIIDKVFK
jgi:GTP-binding protein